MLSAAIIVAPVESRSLYVQQRLLLQHHCMSAAATTSSTTTPLQIHCNWCGYGCEYTYFVKPLKCFRVIRLATVYVCFFRRCRRHTNRVLHLKIASLGFGLEWCMRHQDCPRQHDQGKGRGSLLYRRAMGGGGRILMGCVLRFSTKAVHPIRGASRTKSR